MTQFKKVAIVAGEASGDILGAGLIEEIQKKNPECEFFGIGGERMKALNFESWFPMDRLSVMGLIEPLKRLFELLRMRRHLKNRIAELSPDVFIGVDAPDFNLNLEKYLKKKGIRTVHYVSPSVWAWRQKRIHNIKVSVDLMLCLFPFEEAFYQQHQVSVACVGHTLADQIPILVDKQEARSQLVEKTKSPHLPLCQEYFTERKLIALLPGSRASEVRYHMDLFLRAASLCLESRPDLEFIVPAANPQRYEEIKRTLENYPLLKVYLILGESQTVMSSADAILLASGTTALEAMLLKRPMVVAYRMSALAFSILKRMVRVPFVSLPNLLAGRELVPERLQDKASPHLLAQELLQLLNKPQEELLAEFRRIHLSLRLNANKIAVQAIEAMCSENPK